MSKSSINIAYYYSYISTLDLLGFVAAARGDFQPKHPSYSKVGHFMWCDGRVAREREILPEYGIENPRVDGSIPSQATKLKSPFP